MSRDPFDAIPLHEQGEGQAHRSPRPYDTSAAVEAPVRIRMTVLGVPEPHLHCADPLQRAHAPKPEFLWSDRMPRRIAEADMAGGPVHLAIEHGDGRRVMSAAIVPWRFN